MVSSPGARFSADSCRNPTSGSSVSTPRSPGEAVTVTRRRCRLCHALVTSSQTSTRMPRTRSSSSSSRVPSSAASFSASWTRARSCAARSRRASAKPVERNVPGADVAGSPLASLAYCRARLRVYWSSLSPEASGSTSSTTHSGSPSGSAPPTQASEDFAVKTGPSTTTETFRGGRTCSSGAGDVRVTLTQVAPASAARAPAASSPSSTTSTARPSRRSSAGVAPNEATLAWKSCSGRSGRGVGGAFGSGSVRGACCGCSGRS